MDHLPALKIRVYCFSRAQNNSLNSFWLSERSWGAFFDLAGQGLLSGSAGSEGSGFRIEQPLPIITYFDIWILDVLRRGAVYSDGGSIRCVCVYIVITAS